MRRDRIHPTAAQQQLLERVRVRVIEAGELERWQQLMQAHHYLRDATLVGACRPGRSGMTTGAAPRTTLTTLLPRL